MKNLIGRKITGLRVMTADEQKIHNWFEASFVLELDDGTCLYPSRDVEGTGPGTFIRKSEKSIVFLF